MRKKHLVLDRLRRFGLRPNVKANYPASLHTNPKGNIAPCLKLPPSAHISQFLESVKSTQKAYVGRPRRPTQEKEKVKIAIAIFPTHLRSPFCAAFIPIQKITPLCLGQKNTAPAMGKTLAG